MKNRKTYYHLVLDQSSSMQDCWSSTLMAITDQMIQIKKMAKEFPQQEFYVSLCVFNDDVNFPQSPVLIDRGIFPSLENVNPRGCTALLDGIGESIQRIEFKAGEELKSNEASVVMVILTDGHENASRRFDSKQISQMMKERKNAEKWSFVFIGADFNVDQLSNSFGVDENSRMNVDKSNMKGAFDSVQSNFRVYAEMKEKGVFKKEFFQSDENNN